MHLNEHHQEVIKLAIAELQHPTLRLTEQILKVHQIIYQDNIAKLASKTDVTINITY